MIFQAFLGCAKASAKCELLSSKSANRMMSLRYRKTIASFFVPSIKQIGILPLLGTITPTLKIETCFALQENISVMSKLLVI